MSELERSPWGCLIEHLINLGAGVFNYLCEWRKCCTGNRRIRTEPQEVFQ